MYLPTMDSYSLAYYLSKEIRNMHMVEELFLIHVVFSSKGWG